MRVDLTPKYKPAVNGGEQSAASRDTSRSKADCSLVIPARAGSALSANLAVGQRSQHPGEAAIITAARPVIIKEILKLLGKDIPSPRHHAKYLRTVPFSDLCARRDQLLQERLPMQQDIFGQPKREPLELQPELFDLASKHDRSTKYFGALTPDAR